MHTQLQFEDLGTPLSDVTFVVVDLETTGLKSDVAQIIEIGAVKVRGGEVLGEFATLVQPNSLISSQITLLTGITNDMVRGAPPISAVFPTFLEFAHGAVLVAHNAGFDISFLKAAANALHYPWPNPQVLDTVKLARQAIPRSETPNYRLGTLARLIRTEVEPNHRALSDARATVDLLHYCLEQLASLGVTHLSDLRTIGPQVPPQIRRKAALSDDLPNGPGVYWFRDSANQLLYVGKSTGIRNRVRQYFTGSETRKHIKEMLNQVESVSFTLCGTPLEAEVRELRMIRNQKPHYNRAAVRVRATHWLRAGSSRGLQTLSVSRIAGEIGPFSGKRAAEEYRDLLRRSCALSGVSDHLEAFSTQLDVVVAHFEELMTQYGRNGDYEAALRVRNQLHRLLAQTTRLQLQAMMLREAELVLAKHTAQSTELVALRHGALVGSTTLTAGGDLDVSAQVLLATAEVSGPETGPDELQLVCSWFTSDDTTVLVSTSQQPLLQVSALKHSSLLRQLSSAARA